MRTRRDEAIELFRKRFNCSQAVFTAYRQREFLDEATALRLATVFGAGVACTGNELCGAVSGALMALSMKHGRGDEQSVEAKAKTYALAQDFLQRFGGRFGGCRCEQVLGFNLGTPEGLKRAQDEKLFETRCLDAVKAAAEILDEMLPEEL
ncbi:MAG: C-GCAxxG-C-C family protein [Myxococcales bacterium]